MNFIIVADKFQKRMKSKGCVGLLKDNKYKTVIEKQYSIIREIFPTCKIVYIYGFDYKRFESFIHKKNFINTSFIYNPDYEKYNTLYSLYLTKNFLNDACIISFGDTYMSKKTFMGFDTKIGSQAFISQNNNKLGCVIQNNEIEHISYDLNNSLSEIYYLTKKHAIFLKRILETEEFHQYFLFEILNKSIDEKYTIRPHKHK
jgi:CTP:phosphocholine cytidylyltransferase-like protein